MIPCDGCIELECDKCPLWYKYKGGAENEDIPERH